MERHSTYFTVLETIQTAKDCALCKLEADAAHAYFDAILYEAVNDPQVRAALVKSYGYCHRHAHYLSDMRDSFGIAILYQDQINLFQELLNQKQLHHPKGKVPSNSIHVECPACANQLEIRRRYIAVLLENLPEPEIKIAYEASPGFCLPHLAILREAATDYSLHDYFTAIEKRNLARLGEELREFIRKHDYRFSNEPYGPERDSWARVIKKLTGSRDVF